MSHCRFRRLNAPREERFWLRVKKGAPDECWEWQGATVGEGYGSFFDPGGTRRAHRFSMELLLGRKLRSNELVCHHCDNPPCVNPAHLYVGSAQDNVDDMMARGRHCHHGFTHCAHGHELTPENITTYLNRGKLIRRCLVCVRAERARGSAMKKTRRHALKAALA